MSATDSFETRQDETTTVPESMTQSQNDRFNFLIKRMPINEDQKSQNKR